MGVNRERSCRYGNLTIRIITGCLALGAVATSNAFAVVPGALDDFQDLTMQGWQGFPDNMRVKPDGGPLGLGDAYLEVTADGGRSGGSAATYNPEARWAGDYLAAGVTSVEVDFRNIGETPLSMRAVIFLGPVGRMTSSSAFIVPPDGSWYHAVFPLDAGSMTIVSGAFSYNSLITGATQIMFRHDSGVPDAGGEAVVATLGIDNVHSIPAPGVMGAFGAVALMGLRRRR